MMIIPNRVEPAYLHGYEVLALRCKIALPETLHPAQSWGKPGSIINAVEVRLPGRLGELGMKLYYDNRGKAGERYLRMRVKPKSKERRVIPDNYPGFSFEGYDVCLSD